MTTRGSVLAASIACAAAIAACAHGEDNSSPAGTRVGDRISGASSTLGGAEVGTYAVSDGAGGVSHVGATVPLAVFTAATPENATAEFPDIVKQTTFFNHIYFTKPPYGHPPVPYLVEHLDLYFFGITVAERETIDCTNEVMPAADLIPGGYVITGAGDAANGGSCIPMAGVHAIDTTSPELALQNPAPFTKTMGIGYHGGEVAFLEPMVTRETLEARQSFTLAVPQPSHLDRKTRWPTRFDATYEPTTDSYSFVFSEFVPLSDVPPLE